jgi:CheY-like chemotaxis protein
MAGTGQLILLVDDDRDFLELNRDVLQRQGYRVECCSDSAQALAVMERERPALVVTDLMMKALDSGFSLAREIKERERFAGIPIIIVTAVGSQRGFDFTPRDQAELQAMKADAFFDKPVSPQALIAKVRELLS